MTLKNGRRRLTAAASNIRSCSHPSFLSDIALGIEIIESSLATEELKLITAVPPPRLAQRAYRPDNPIYSVRSQPYLGLFTFR